MDSDWEVYSQLLHRLGYEVGRVFRLLLQNEVNWGYYFDHDPFMPHCNAHPNNFIVLD